MGYTSLLWSAKGETGGASCCAVLNIILFLNMQQHTCVPSPSFKQSSGSCLFPCISIWLDFFFLTRAFGPIHTPPVYDINTLDTAPSEGALTLSHSPSRHLKWSRTLSGGILPFAAPPLFSTIFYFFSPPTKALSILSPLERTTFFHT